MDFISNQKEQVEEMLKKIGISHIEELLASVPKTLKQPKPEVDDGLSEYEGIQLMEAIAAKNTFQQRTSYLGAGAYEHHVPAIVGAICGKSEFLTSYTPYQPEASQGMLQATFEFQSAVCALTGMDAANASVYDGASACAEGLMMALRHNKERGKILIARTVHPYYCRVIEQFLSSHSVQIEWVSFNTDGSVKQEEALKLIDNQTAALLIQSPNFFGVMEDVNPIAAKAKSCGALTIVCANPLAYGLYASAAELGADIAVGDTQPFGLPLQFGGPYVGYLACRQELVRQMPGRIVGETVDSEGRRGFALTLQTREQHIRREKATSNICTNQALAALASLISILWYGREGIQKLALTNYQRAAYLKSKLGEVPGFKAAGDAPFFNEFVVKAEFPREQVFAHFRKHGIEPGIDLENYEPALKNHLLIAVTETKSKNQLDHYVEIAAMLKK